MILHKWNEWTTNYNLPIAVVTDQNALFTGRYNWKSSDLPKPVGKTATQSLFWINQFKIVFCSCLSKGYWILLSTVSTSRSTSAISLNILHFIWNTLSDWSKVWRNKVHTKFTWTRSVMGSYQILYAIA